MVRFIRGSERQPTPRAEEHDASPRLGPGQLRRADWLLGGAIATLAVVFVAGLLGLRGSTAELQDQSRSITRDLTALKADTLDRIHGIAGDLAKTNQALTDLIALRSQEASAVPPAGGEAPSRAPARTAATKPAAPRDGKAGVVKAGVVKSGVVKSGFAKAEAAKVSPPQPVARPETLTVRRKPTRARERIGEARKRPTTAGRAVAAQRPEPRSPAACPCREATLRQRRPARRNNGPQPL